MQPTSFTANSAAEALAQIRAKLGPEAVVLNVRPLPANGISRLWQRPMIEALAYRPQPQGLQAAPISEALTGYIEQLKEARRGSEIQEPQPDAAVATPEPEPAMEISAPAEEAPAINDGKWRVGALLQQTGFSPVATQRVLDKLRFQFGDEPPASFGDEISLTKQVLENLWRKPRPLAPNSTHVLVGPAGSGKTTCLCKWLTQSSLMEGRMARVWRLDGATANMAEALSVYCEILGVPGERVWQGGSSAMAEDIGFIDLPGVDWRQPMAIKELGSQLKRLGSPTLHLVLNGAYDLSVLLAQLRAFACLPIADLIITHLDEEPRWGKLWNVALGTNYSIRHFSTGQNIPGDFCEASPEVLFARQFPRK